MAWLPAGIKRSYKIRDLSKATEPAIPAAFVPGSPLQQRRQASRGHSEAEPITQRSLQQVGRPRWDRKGDPSTQGAKRSQMLSWLCHVTPQCRQSKDVGSPHTWRPGLLGTEGSWEWQEKGEWTRARARARRGRLSPQGPSKHRHPHKCCNAICQKLNVMQKKPRYTDSQSFRWRQKGSVWCEAGGQGPAHLVPTYLSPKRSLSLRTQTSELAFQFVMMAYLSRQEDGTYFI